MTRRWGFLLCCVAVVACNSSVSVFGDGNGTIDEESVFSDTEGVDNCAAATVNGALEIEKAHLAQLDLIDVMFAELEVRCEGIATTLGVAITPSDGDRARVEANCRAVAEAIEMRRGDLVMSYEASACSTGNDPSCEACEGQPECIEACGTRADFEQLMCPPASIQATGSDAELLAALDAHYPAVLRVTILGEAISTLELRLNAAASKLSNPMLEDVDNCGGLIAPLNALLESIGEAGQASSDAWGIAVDLESATG